MNTFLGADGSPSDRLVINGGTATGTTGLLIHNAAGPGLETTANGIFSGECYLRCDDGIRCLYA